MTQEVTAEMRDLFDQAAEGWEKWAEILDQRDPGRYLSATDMEEGDRVLEVGAGTGLQTLAIAQRVGHDGSVVALDLSVEMLAVAKRRVRAAGLENVAFHVASFGEFDFGSDKFDAAVSGLTWMFLPDPIGDAIRVHNLLETGGWFAASIWGPPSDVSMFSLPMSVITRELGVEPPEASRSKIGPLDEPGVFHRVLTEAGFDKVVVTPFQVEFTYRSGEQFAEWVRDVVISVRRVMEEHGRGGEDDIYDKIAAAANNHATKDSTITLTNHALLGTGQRTK